MGAEIGPGGSGCINADDGSIFVDDDVLAFDDVGNISGGLFEVALNIHGESRSLGDGQTEVEGDTSRDSTETDEETPHEVDAVQLLD